MATVSGGTTAAEDLARLSDLLDKGRITEAEYQQQKTRIMAGGGNRSVQIEHTMSPLLAIGILLFPIIFVWFTLRNGYTTAQRAFAFGYLLLGFILWGFLLSGTDRPDAQTASALNRPAVIEETISASSGQQTLSAASAAPSAQPAAANQAVAVTSQQLAQAYENNEAAAQQSFGNRTLQVTGTVTGITLDLMDNPVLELEGVNQFMSVHASFTKAWSGRLSSMVKGQQATVICTKVTEVISTPMLNDCTM